MSIAVSFNFINPLSKSILLGLDSRYVVILKYQLFLKLPILKAFIY